jgi:hypothetical protein
MPSTSFPVQENQADPNFNPDPFSSTVFPGEDQEQD